MTATNLNKKTEQCIGENYKMLLRIRKKKTWIELWNIIMMSSLPISLFCLMLFNSIVQCDNFIS